MTKFKWSNLTFMTKYCIIMVVLIVIALVLGAAMGGFK
jgi:hypothetical protein